MWKALCQALNTKTYHKVAETPVNGQRIECNDTCTNAIAQLSKLMAQKLTRTIEVYFSSVSNANPAIRMCSSHLDLGSTNT